MGTSLRLLAILIALGASCPAATAEDGDAQQQEQKDLKAERRASRAAVLSALNASEGSSESALDAQTTLFGIPANGRRIVYVFDRSGSMSEHEGRPLAAAKRELLKSLSPLEATHQFQIIFYNQAPRVLNPHRSSSPKLLYGNQRDKEAAASFVESIDASGGTAHLDSLQMALRMAPDVIYFLTDAAEPPLSDKELAQVRRWNTSAAAIHTIEFGVGPSPAKGSFLAKLAKENRGQHAYFDVTELTADE